MKKTLFTAFLILTINTIYSQTAADSMYVKGLLDASLYYEGKNCGATGTVLTTMLLSPILGLAPAIICSRNEPQIQNLNAPNTDLLMNTNYLKGYLEESHKIKKKRIWVSYGISAGATILLISTISALN